MFDAATKLKSRMAGGEVTLGTWITLSDADVAEILAGCPFDWLVIDMEHSAIGLAEAQRLIQVISLAGAVPLVRTTDQDPGLIKRVLDGGAAGVVVPNVRTPDEARAIVSAVKYPPVGSRGVGLWRAQGYGLDFESYKAWVNDGTITILQIEHVDGVEALDTILEVPGVDGIIVGPYDLSGSIGVPGQLDDPKVEALVARVIDVGRAKGVPVGYHVVGPDPAQVQARMAQGFTFIGYTLDSLMLAASFGRDLETLGRGG